MWWTFGNGNPGREPGVFFDEEGAGGAGGAGGESGQGEGGSTGNGGQGGGRKLEYTPEQQTELNRIDRQNRSPKGSPG